jgi:hypothetical protein
MISELYDALKSAGAPEDQARKAAEVVANYDNHFSAIENQMTRAEGDLTLLKWMVGFVLAFCIGIVMLLLRHQ